MACTTALASGSDAGSTGLARRSIAALPVGCNSIGMEVIFILGAFSRRRIWTPPLKSSSSPSAWRGDVLTEENLGFGDAFDFQAHRYQVVQAGGLEVFKGDAAHDKGDARLAQEVALLVADGTQPFGARQRSRNFRQSA